MSSSSSTAVASGLLVGGFADTWSCTTFTGGVKVPPNVQRNINGKPAPQKRRRQPPCRALRCSVLAPSFGRLGRAWIWTGPNWNQIAQADRPTSNSTAQPGQGRSRQLTTPTGTLFFCPGFLQDWTYSIINPSVHSPARPPPTLASLVTRDRSSQSSTYLHHHRALCSLLLVITAAAF